MFLCIHSWQQSCTETETNGRSICRENTVRNENCCIFVKCNGTDTQQLWVTQEAANLAS